MGIISLESSRNNTFDQINSLPYPVKSALSFTLPDFCPPQSIFLLAFVSCRIAPLSILPACSPSIPPVSPLRPPLPYSNIFTLCILLFSSIYFRISPYLSSSPSLTVSFLHFSQLLQLDVCKLFPGDRVLSSVLQGTTSNSSWVCTHPHRPTRRLMSRLSKTAPRLNIDHQASVPRTLREAICQGDNLFCSTRYGVPGTQLFFLLVVSGPDRHHYRSKSGSLCVP